MAHRCAVRPMLPSCRENTFAEKLVLSIHKKYMEEADEEIAKNEAYLEKLYERKLSEEEAKQESVMIKLRSDFENNRDRWVDEIVNRVIG